jgi:hypothetical protein
MRMGTPISLSMLRGRPRYYFRPKFEHSEPSVNLTVQHHRNMGASYGFNGSITSSNQRNDKFNKIGVTRQNFGKKKLSIKLDTVDIKAELDEINEYMIRIETNYKASYGSPTSSPKQVDNLPANTDLESIFTYDA